MIGAIVFPNISPVAFTVYGFDVYWYSFAYIIGFILGYKIIQRLAKYNHALDDKALDDLFMYTVLSLIACARLGFMLFYDFDTMIEHPLQLFMIRDGGMSFHGGLIGVVLAVLLVCRKHKLYFLKITDLICCVAPIGIFFGRLANFINQEMYGKITDVSWAVIFPVAGAEPRHPSQLYEAMLEGVALFIIMQIAFHNGAYKKQGRLTGIFVLSYGIFRSFIEFFKESEWIYMNIAAGQILSIPMIFIGMYLILRKL